MEHEITMGESFNMERKTIKRNLLNHVISKTTLAFRKDAPLWSLDSLDLSTLFGLINTFIQLRYFVNLFHLEESVNEITNICISYKALADLSFL